MKEIERQNKEFDALTKLAKRWETLRGIAVVDDDYPDYRGLYEGALIEFIQALKDNGRL